MDWVCTVVDDFPTVTTMNSIKPFQSRIGDWCCGRKNQRKRVHPRNASCVRHVGAQNLHVRTRHVWNEWIIWKFSAPVMFLP